MTALVLADMDDIHWHGPTGKADLLIGCGDVCENLIREAADAHGCSTILAVKGNHDTPDPFTHRVTDLHLRRVEFGGLAFAGFNGCWRYKPRGDFLYEQHEVLSALRRFPAVDVFVAHNSPRGVHDKDDDVHQGFDAFALYINQLQPRLFVHGHQHANRETRVGPTLVRGVHGAVLLHLPAPPGVHHPHP